MNWLFVCKWSCLHKRLPLSCQRRRRRLQVGRTGFSVNRWDFGVSEEMGMRRTMEDKAIVVQDVVVPELDATDNVERGGPKHKHRGNPLAALHAHDLLKPQSW